MWKCKACGYVNDTALTHCDNCDKARLGELSHYNDAGSFAADVHLGDDAIPELGTMSPADLTGYLERKGLVRKMDSRAVFDGSTPAGGEGVASFPMRPHAPAVDRTALPPPPLALPAPAQADSPWDPAYVDPDPPGPLTHHDKRFLSLIVLTIAAVWCIAGLAVVRMIWK